MANEKEVFGSGGFSRFVAHLIDRFVAKFDKIGGEITGDVQIDGNLTLDIEDPDYDAGIRISKTLDTNAGPILTLTGYANGSENTTYKPVIRNVANPINDYDVANKRYVESKVIVPSSYFVFLNADFSIDTYSSALTYAKVKSELTNYTTDVFLDVVYNNTSRIHVSAMEDQDTNAGPIVFLGSIRMSDGTLVDIVFLLDGSNVLTSYITTRENALLKTSDVETNKNSIYHYPTTKGVYDFFQRKPDIVYETDGTTGLLALQKDLSADPGWQLTNLDLSPYRRIKVHAKAGRGATSASAEPAKVLEILLDSRGANAATGHYVGSMVFQNPNDSNRIGTLTCAVSADKTSFAVLRMTSLYGTAASSNNGTNSYVYLIEGYYD